MKINLKVKKLSRPDKIIADIDYEMSFEKGKISDLIRALVEIEVERYNSKDSKEFAFIYSNEQEIDKQASVGKIGFGVHYSERKADLNKAIATAFEAFEDGLVRLFVNEKEFADLDEEIVLHNDDQLILFRMTFITGRMY